MTNPFRSLPSVSELLEAPELADVRRMVPHDSLVAALRRELDRARAEIAAGRPVATTSPDLLASAIASLQIDLRPRLRTVLNATGIVLHTNLGRAPMAESAARAAYDAARGYLNLEFDLATGERSSRQNAVRDGICSLTGAEAATTVNNCAAATVIVLRALAAGKEVIVSRGQLIEIGGSFRIPDILQVSGATLREVGTTNITRAADYDRAIGPNTGAIMRVHASNYRVRGFTQSASIDELVAIGRKHGVPVIDDVGSGAAVDFAALGFPDEPLVGDGIRAGADVVLFSGDKLLGGPQAGIIAGKRRWIDAIEKDPFMRAVRLDKMALAALEATLALYRDPVRALSEVPVLRMMTTPIQVLRHRCERLAERIRVLDGIAALEVFDDTAFVGGGSLPDQAIPTVILAASAKAFGEDEFARRLRVGEPAVLARIRNGRVLVDLRTVFPAQEDALVSAIQTAVRESP
ncbi:MAG: L-seryl-tRNA(Sec) selenium transferase [Planctomycetia bacterium]|nr:L-seryl-tRNA(Sec) selenium transferase [Planctomycetia bacterium]